MAAFFALPIEQFPLVGENGDQMELGYAVKYTGKMPFETFFPSQL